MAKKHGKDGVVQISDTAVAEVTSWSLDTSSNQAEGSAMGEEFTTNLAGIKSQSGTIECNYDETDTAGQQVLAVGSVVEVKLFTEADQSGATFDGGNVLVTQVSVAAPRDGIISRSFSFVNADSSGITEQTVI